MGNLNCFPDNCLPLTWETGNCCLPPKVVVSSRYSVSFVNSSLRPVGENNLMCFLYTRNNNFHRFSILSVVEKVFITNRCICPLQE